MIPLVIKMDGDNAWPDLRGKTIHHVKEKLEVAVLDKGMTSGRPSVAIRLDLEDGSSVIAETSARLFCAAAKALMAKYPDLFDGN